MKSPSQLQKRLALLFIGISCVLPLQAQNPELHFYPPLDTQNDVLDLAAFSIDVDQRGNDYTLSRVRAGDLGLDARISFRKNNEFAIGVPDSQNWRSATLFHEGSGQFRIFYSVRLNDQRNSSILMATFRPGDTPASLSAPQLLIDDAFTFRAIRRSEGGYFLCGATDIFNRGVDIVAVSQDETFERVNWKPGLLSEPASRAFNFDIAEGPTGRLRLLSEAISRKSDSTNASAAQYSTYDFAAPQDAFSEQITLESPSESFGNRSSFSLETSSDGEPFAVWQNNPDRSYTLASRTASTGWVTEDRAPRSPLVGSTDHYPIYVDSRGRSTILYPGDGDTYRSAVLIGTTWSNRASVGIRALQTNWALGPDRTPHFFRRQQENSTFFLQRSRYLDATDLDGDGLSFLYETALASDPTDGSDTPTDTVGNNYPRFVAFNRQRARLISISIGSLTLVAPGTYRNLDEAIEIRVEVSRDLENWITPNNIVSETRFSFGRNFVNFTQAPNLDDDDSYPFMRLKIFRGF